MNGTAISQRIREIMASRGLNQQLLAEKLQITQPAVSKYLSGRIPPPTVLLRLSRLSGKSIEWILTGSDSPAPPSGVAEPADRYRVLLGTNEKLESLPPPIKRSVCDLIDRLYAELVDK